MKKLTIIPADTAIDFMGRRKIAFVFSAMLVLASAGLFLAQGLNLGIDFLGGILIEVKTEGSADVGGMRSTLGQLGLGDISLQEFGEPDVVLIRIQRQPGGDEAQQEAVAAVKDTLDLDKEAYRRTETVGPTVGEELREAAIIAVLAAIGAILVYIWFRFEWQFGVAAVVALLHDVISTVGLFSLLQLEFNLATVAAVLTIAGYSINDTVVVFDRVRENLRKYKRLPLPDLFNLSINGTLSRTVMTSLTTLLALVSLYILGGEVIRGFSVALIWGIVVGTYSSIALAVPLLLYLKVYRGAGEEQAEPAGANAEG
ncbi:MAG: protein translocase subunit SecF [Alphaproteobacteria bacterium]|nr:protein translocase subunit SecF [Alphaproteobacteria bacterium]